jgi:tetratricopeptide (TPR) repeat protein
MNLNAGSQGGGPVDQWNIDQETRLKLERKYRDAAAQEAAIGNWGRAAYIYGALLGDWSMAAQMLEKAGRSREAARIYTERLHSVVRAAQCLEKAGLLAEAVTLYREAGMPEKAGDLLADLGQIEAAREQWKLALQKLTNPLDQAKLLEVKLQDPDRALFVLDRAWPASARAQACFEAVFDLLGRHGRHEEAMAVLDRLERKPEARLPQITQQVSALNRVYATYPDSAITIRSAELGLHFSGEWLQENPTGSHSKSLLTLLHHLAPADRLLSRDANRFSIGHNRPLVPLLTRRGGSERVDRIVQLEERYHWQSLCSNGMALYAAGWVYNEKLKANALVTATVGEAANEHPWPACPAETPRVQQLFCGGSNRFAVTHFQRQNTVNWHTPDGFFTTVPGLAIGPSSNADEFLVLGLKDTGALMVEIYGTNSNVLRTRVLDLAPRDIGEECWFTGGNREDVWIGGLSVACCVNEKIEFQIAHLNGPVTCFAVAPAILPSQAIAVSNSEAILLTPQGKGKPLECVNLYAGSEAHPPVATFTRDGRAVVADAHGGVIYNLRDGCTKEADLVIPPNTSRILAAGPHGPQGFGLLTANGQVLIYIR